jgi:hypothetical protein
LIKAETERNLWAERYDRDYRDILMLHGEVALGIAREIKIAVTPAEKTRLASARPVDAEAHDRYHRECGAGIQLTPAFITEQPSGPKRTFGMNAYSPGLRISRPP